MIKGTGNSMEILWQDLRLAFRTLLKNPGFTAVAVLTLGLGIGANTAIFSVVNSVLLRPLPYPKPDRLVMLWERSPRRGFERERVSGPDFIDWREQNDVFENIGFSSGEWASDVNLVGPDGVDKVKCAYALSSFFPVLGVNALIGRTFLPEEDQREGNRAAIIGYELWRRRFAADPNVLGQTLTTDTYGRRDYAIVGVMPPGFHFPDGSELWLPFGWLGVRLDERRSGHWHQVIGRLKPTVTLDQAQTEMNAIQGRIEQRYPDEVVGSHVAVVPLLEQTLGRTMRPAFIILWGVVACVLLIACANVANLLLVRAAARQGEVAIRVVLGAGRWQVIRRLLTEGLLLAILGGAFGVLLAVWSLHLLIAAGADQIPRLDEVEIDGRALVLTLLTTLATWLFCGLAPALHGSKPELTRALKEGGGGSTGALRRNRTSSMLVVSEVAMSLVLLIGAGLMINSFLRLSRIDRGFQSDHLLTAQMDFSVSGFTTWVRPTATRPQVTLQAVIDRLMKQPGVQSVAAVSKLPANAGSARTQTIVIENRPPVASGEYPTASFQGVTPDYFRTMGIPLLEGRPFTESDVLEAPRVVIINETTAKSYFPNEDPIGKRLAMGGRNPGQPALDLSGQASWSVIVGLVANTRKLNMSAETVPDVYVPYWQFPMQSPVLVVRTAAEGTTIADATRSLVKAVNPNLPPPAIRMMDEILDESVATPRFQTLLLSLFGAVAVVLAAIGIYGVMSFSVTQRSHEIGIRMALGARRSHVLRLIVGNGMRLALAGVAIGLLAALVLARVLSSLLYDVKPNDPATYAAVVTAFLSVTLLACWLPARRATRVDPIVTLRYE